MLHPSYTELMNAQNNGAENSEEPTINSRYSIVIAASRRARQLIEEREGEASDNCFKPLSVAVDELYKGDVRIVSEDDVAEEDIVLDSSLFTEIEAEDEVVDELVMEDTNEDME